MEIVKIDKRIENIDNEIAKLDKDIKKQKKYLSQLIKEKDKVDGNLALFTLESNVSIKLDSIDEEAYVKEYLQYRDEVSDKDFFNRVLPLLKKIPESNGSRYFKKFEVNVGIVSDEFLYHSFKDVANFHYLTNKNYKELAHALDFILIVTTWKGLNKEWRGLANENSNRRKELYEIIEFFRGIDKKVVFYSKEDPVNYEKFVEIAKRCDYIFTTAEEIIPRYKEECKNENVFVLEFGVNPLYHNPVGMRTIKKSNDVFFAGSWLTKYPERQKETKDIFNGVIEAGRNLKIIDRNFEINHPDYFFPREYAKYISPSISHEYLQKIHKLYNWAINLNSVKYSNTMFANRVYELQAIGNIILSNYSVGVNNLFPNVFIINDSLEVKDIINSFTDEEVFEHQVGGIRNVMSSYTTFHRFNHLLLCIGEKGRLPKHRVLVVVNEMNQQIKQQFESQTYPYKHIVTYSEFTQELKEQFEIIAFFNSKYEYGEFYLEDMINAFKYTDVDYVTKSSYYNGEKFIEETEHDFVEKIGDKYRSVFWSSKFQLKDFNNMNGETPLPNGYSIDRFEFNMTSNVNKNVVQPKKYELSVIVPVYNNGKYLLNKCFNSLKRSSIFKEMEIIIIDDGSTDEFTKLIVKRLEKHYPNVRAYYFNDNGSGSASRPRNKGAELATADFITYLDPDNEAVNDGYARLLEELKIDTELDLVIGNMIKLDNTKKGNFLYYKTVNEAIGSSIIKKPHKLLIETNMRAQSIQALIVKKSIVVENNLKMIQNAGGQDTLFFQELLLHSKKTKVIDLVIHIYYAAVAGSVTNTITDRFFNKFYILEKERLPFLKKHGLINVYMEKRFNFYFKNWYLKRLNMIEEQHLEGSIDTLYKIYELYKEYIVIEDKIITTFERLYKKKEYNQIVVQCCLN
ncbi:glycosyltransferase [Lysinibacillus halotolerans]|uniref:Glycosyltransferase n=1 Tax=Lysinibacillus halotolerans TaxID=1368476 RepID=A0A3M8HIR4_9BACI|nr:glycosyltransferase [Lysinibacillus halotolerans]RND01814.1 glycosyltransferase [Lysinibacillus halotolerans]